MVDGLVGKRMREVGLVECSKEVRPEPQANSLCAQRENLGQGQIEVRQTRAVIVVTSGGAHSSCRRRLGKVGCVEGGVRVSIVLTQRPGSHDVRPVTELIEAAEIQGIIQHRKGGTALNGRNSVDLPAANYLAVSP